VLTWSWLFGHQPLPGLELRDLLLFEGRGLCVYLHRLCVLGVVVSFGLRGYMEKEGYVMDSL
jgi:hypothetical protein